jgi:hypothetical protein
MMLQGKLDLKDPNSLEAIINEAMEITFKNVEDWSPEHQVCIFECAMTLVGRVQESDDRENVEGIEAG